MPPQIKSDINRSGWETTDFPSVCENCLSGSAFVRMLKEDYGAECKLCTRPFTIFSWPASRAQGRKKRTNVCLACARLKNCCQCCTLDLSFGLPIAIRDAALKMVAPGPTSDINREYFAQNNHDAINKGAIGCEEYEKIDMKSRDLLQRLAQSKPYFRKGRQVDDDGKPTYTVDGQPSTKSGFGSALTGAVMGGPGPIRSRDSRAARSVGAAPIKTVLGLRKTPRSPPLLGSDDWRPPADGSTMSLFVTGIEDDLPEYKIRDFFKRYGKLRSVVCSHMSHCAFINYDSREAAERAATSCQGRAVISGCPLRVRWGQTRPVGMIDRDQRMEMIRDGRSAFPELRKLPTDSTVSEKTVSKLDRDCECEDGRIDSSSLIVEAPPGTTATYYASSAAN